MPSLVNCVIALVILSLIFAKVSRAIELRRLSFGLLLYGDCVNPYESELCNCTREIDLISSLMSLRLFS